MLCELCEREIESGAAYFVRILVLADPTMPAMTSEQIAATNLDKSFAELLDQMKHMSEEELQDGVYRQFEFRLCPVCQREFLANPLGKPRHRPTGRN